MGFPALQLMLSMLYHVFFFPPSSRRTRDCSRDVFCAGGAALSETGASDAQQSSKLTASPGTEQ